MRVCVCVCVCATIDTDAKEDIFGRPSVDKCAQHKYIFIQNCNFFHFFLFLFLFFFFEDIRQSFFFLFFSQNEANMVTEFSPSSKFKVHFFLLSLFVSDSNYSHFTLLHFGFFFGGGGEHFLAIFLKF